MLYHVTTFNHFCIFVEPKGEASNPDALSSPVCIYVCMYVCIYVYEEYEDKMDVFEHHFLLTNYVHLLS